MPNPEVSKLAVSTPRTRIAGFRNANGTISERGQASIGESAGVTGLQRATDGLEEPHRRIVVRANHKSAV